MVNRCRCFHLCHYTWAQTLGIRWTAEHASIVMNSVWALLQKPMWYGWNSCKLSIASFNYFPNNEKVAEIAALEFPILETISWGDYHLQLSTHLEGIFIKDISPKNFKGESVEITRNYFGLTVKIHVHSGTFMWVSKSHGSQAHLGHPVSKGSSMIHHFSGIP